MGADADGGGQVRLGAAPLSPNRIETLFRQSEQRMFASQHPRRREATARIFASKTLLKNMDAQKKLRTRLWLEQRKITTIMRCGIKLEAINNYINTAGPEADKVPIHKNGTSYSKSSRSLMKDLKTQTKTTPAGESYVRAPSHYCYAYRYA